ncbi:hypothetical protein ACGFJ7_22230 [Actinoplanes sp. NPDC048988]|uniref:hypothetical protein n=1 Tax=Actinoplanes sp. NPDC048988 TaxID=3363901 RepID=UPI003721009D
MPIEFGDGFPGGRRHSRVLHAAKLVVVDSEEALIHTDDRVNVDALAPGLPCNSASGRLFARLGRR